MGLFRKNKKQIQSLAISGEELLKVIPYYIKLAEEEISKKLLVNATDMMFEFNDKPHVIGLTYDSKQAKLDGATEFSIEYCSFFLDKQTFHTEEIFYNSAMLDGKLLRDIPSGIDISVEYKDLFQEQSGGDDK